jgi:hypothetical protein
MIVTQDRINARLVLRFPLRRLLLVALTLPAGHALVRLGHAVATQRRDLG